MLQEDELIEFKYIVEPIGVVLGTVVAIAIVAPAPTLIAPVATNETPGLLEVIVITAPTATADTSDLPFIEVPNAAAIVFALSAPTEVYVIGVPFNITVYCSPAPAAAPAIVTSVSCSIPCRCKPTVNVVESSTAVRVIFLAATSGTAVAISALA